MVNGKFGRFTVNDFGNRLTSKVPTPTMENSETKDASLEEYMALKAQVSSHEFTDAGNLMMMFRSPDKNVIVEMTTPTPYDGPSGDWTGLGGSGVIVRRLGHTAYPVYSIRLTFPYSASNSSPYAHTVKPREFVHCIGHLLTSPTHTRDFDRIYSNFTHRFYDRGHPVAEFLRTHAPIEKFWEHMDVLKAEVVKDLPGHIERSIGDRTLYKKECKGLLHASSGALRFLDIQSFARQARNRDIPEQLRRLANVLEGGQKYFGHMTDEEILEVLEETHQEILMEGVHTQ